MKQIKFVDTTVRDGSLSLWALGMRTGAMLAIAEQMDQCGFESMEFFGFAGYIKYVKEHKENPWDWMGLRGQEVSPHAAALPRRAGFGIRENPALGALTDDRARGRARHYADALIRSVERLRRGGRRDRRAAKARHGGDRQHHLFGLAAPHRRILRHAGAPSGGDQALPHLLQRRRRFADAGAHAHADSIDPTKHRRDSAGVSRSLQQRHGAVQLS